MHANSVVYTGTINQIQDKNGMLSILIAHSESYEKDGEKKTKTDYVWVKATQKVLGTFSKGDEIKVRGKLTGGQFYSDKDGRYSNNLCIFAFSFFPVEEEELIEDLPTPEPTPTF